MTPKRETQNQGYDLERLLKNFRRIGSAQFAEQQRTSLKKQSRRPRIPPRWIGVVAIACEKLEWKAFFLLNQIDLPLASLGAGGGNGGVVSSGFFPFPTCPRTTATMMRSRSTITIGRYSL